MGNGRFGFRNKYEVTCYKNVWEDGQLIQIPKWKEYIFNLVTYETLNDVLGVYFQGDTQATTWYILLFDSDSTPAGGWTYANIGTDFTEFTDYDETTREEWVDGTVASQMLDNSASPAEFTASTSVDTVIYGTAMVNVSTKGDNSSPSGLIFNAARFTSARPFAETETIKVVLTVNAQDV